MQNLNSNLTPQEQARLKDKPILSSGVGSTSTSTTSTFGTTPNVGNVIKDEIIATNVRTVQDNLSTTLQQGSSGLLQQGTSGFVQQQPLQQQPLSSTTGLASQQPFLGSSSSSFSSGQGFASQPFSSTSNVQSGTFSSTMSSFNSSAGLGQDRSTFPSSNIGLQQQPFSSSGFVQDRSSTFQSSSNIGLQQQPFSSTTGLANQQPLLQQQPSSTFVSSSVPASTFVSGSQPYMQGTTGTRLPQQQMGTGYQSFGTPSFQQWPLGTFYIRSKMNGYVLDAKDVAKAGSSVSAYPLHFAPNQQFRFEQGGIIRNISSGLVLDIAYSLGDRFKGGIHGKNSVFLDNYDGSNSQIWSWDGVHLINMHENKVLDIKGESDKAGATLIVYDMKTSGDLFNQQWELLPI